ncbi:hypothetical protein EUTSA_v10019405mg [Eutrema salsugineum]|uniref:Uncharacterized protein n=1 Tax=Eutrema salsugineum TaxID=72664 RepID=V4K7U4_EUTSA|nr:uncharacterized protein LOC18008110 [Eutrema salsugineum]ESQ27049.1 hypothetical protein EUTSA_v10019405mg [Eutrema salsugineum]
MSSVQQLSVRCTNNKVITEKRRTVTIPSNGNKIESKQTIHHDVDKCAEAFIQNFRRQLLLQCDTILPGARGGL